MGKELLILTNNEITPNSPKQLWFEAESNFYLNDKFFIQKAFPQ